MSATKPLKPVTHILFDMDGVLIDTETLYTKATQNILDNFGKTYSWEVKTQLMGLHGTEVAKRMVEIYDLSISPEEYYTLAMKEYAVIMPKCQLMSDSEHLYKKAIAMIASRFGKKYTPDIQFKLMGTPERESSRIAVEEMKLPITVDKFQSEFRTLAHSYMKNVPLMPGALNLIKHLKQHNIPIAVATSSSRDSYELKTKKHKEFFSMFDHIVTGGSDPEVKKGKPSPDIFLVCASRFADKPCAEKCLVFEDAPNGVTAALNAGMQVVMVPDENVPPELRKDASVVINSLEEAPLQYFGLPSMKNC